MWHTTAQPAACYGRLAFFLKRTTQMHNMHGRRGHLCCVRAHSEYKELLTTLERLGDEELEAWAAEHRDRLSLRFLGWLSDEELAASAGNPDQQEKLWALGSKLMALREGLSPVGIEVLQAQLRSAALGCAEASSSEGGSSDKGQSDVMQQTQQDVAQPPSQQQQQQQQQMATSALAVPAFDSAVRQASSLGLSPEGLALFQQQAAAFEAVVGTSRARSLTEVIGRAQVQDTRQLQGLADADAAARILDVLLGVPERDERAALLPDAFTPPSGAASGDEDAAYASSDEDQVFTTPVRLLQAIDLYLQRLDDGSAAAPGQRAALVGGGPRLSRSQIQAALLELREDVQMFTWQNEEEEQL